MIDFFEIGFRLIPIGIAFVIGMAFMQVIMEKKNCQV